MRVHSLIFFLLVLPTAYSYDYVREINISQLPYNETITFDIQTHINSTIAFHTNSSLLQLPPPITATYNLTTTNLNITLPGNLTPQKYHPYVTINDTTDNVTTQLTFEISILNDTEYINYTDFIQLDLTTYEYPRICDYTIPINITKSGLSVKGTPGANFSGYSIQQKFIHDHINTTIPEDGRLVFSLLLQVNDSKPQTWSEEFRVQVGNITDKFTFIFDIEDCVDPFPDFDYERLAWCQAHQINLTFDEAYDCEKLKLQYQEKLLEMYDERRETKIITNETEVVVHRDVVKWAIEVEDRDKILELIRMGDNMKETSEQMNEVLSEQKEMNDRIVDVEDKIAEAYKKGYEDRYNQTIQLEQLQKKNKLITIFFWPITIFTSVTILFLLGRYAYPPGV